MSRVKYVKKENFIEKLNSFYRQNPQKFRSIFFLLIAGITIIFFVSLHLKRKEAKLVELYYAATSVYNQEMRKDNPSYDKIITEYQKVIELNQSSDYAVNSLFVVADAYYQLKDYENAVDRYSRLIKRTQKKSYLWYQSMLSYSIVLKENDNFDEAIKILDEIISDESSPVYAAAPAKIYLGLIYSIQDDLEKANETYKSVIEKYPDTFWAEQVALKLGQ